MLIVTTLLLLHILLFKKVDQHFPNAMANPPPVRPWFRLSSIRSVPPPAPAPAPAPEARPVYSLPTFRSTASAPSSPQTQPTKPQEPEPRLVPSDKKIVSAPSASLPTSPIQKAPLTTNSSSVSSSSPSRKASITNSPKIIKTESVKSPMHSPKLKPTAPPPSPLTLPPSQLTSEPKIPTEAEQKNVLVHKNVEKPKHWNKGNGELHREGGNHDNAHHGKGKESETKERGIHKKVSDSEDSGMKVITIAGENRGAYMELIQSPNKHEPNHLHKKGNSKINGGDGGELESSSSGEGNANRKDKNHHKGRTTSSFPMAAYMNSNVQCVNNSLLFHASCSHHDPGVRLSLSKKPYGEGYHLKEHVDGYNT